MVESFSCTGVAARSTKMSFNRRPFQFSPDFGTERCSDVIQDAFDDFEEPFETMFSEGLSRWDTPPEFQRFQQQVCTSSEMRVCVCVCGLFYSRCS